MLHTQLLHLPRDTFKFYLKRRDKFFRDATTQASPSMLKHLSSNIYFILRGRIKGFDCSITTIFFEVDSYRSVVSTECG